MKKCTKCGEEKPIDDFYTQKRFSKKLNNFKILYNAACKECTKKKNKEWSLNHPEKVLASKKKHNSKPEVKLKNRAASKTRRLNGRHKAWLDAHPDKKKTYSIRRMNKNHDIMQSQWDDCKLYFNYRCAYCGISEDEAKESQGQYFHKEHVDHNGANDLSNCVPSCRDCNSSKWMFDLTDWYSVGNPVYSKRRLNKIHKWLNEDYKKYI